MGVRVNPEDAEHRVMQIAGTQRTLFRRFAQSIRGTNQLSSPNAATGHETGHGPTPVIASRGAFA